MVVRSSTSGDKKVLLGCDSNGHYYYLRFLLPARQTWDPPELSERKSDRASMGEVFGNSDYYGRKKEGRTVYLPHWPCLFAQIKMYLS